MEEVEDCVFVLASHQIRIHFAKRSDFYLRVRSRPIIEDSDGVRFANYCLKYEGIEEDLAMAALDEETGNWANVDDFKWLRAMQSPNWSILPEEERVGDVDLTNSNSSTRRCGPRLIPIAAGTLAGVDLPPEGLISYLKMMMAMASGHAYLGDSDWDQKRSRPFSDSLRHIFNSNLFISVPFISWCLASVSGC
ncbi:hypothetical protein LWI28_002211 [Acer negundo]|uniref:C-CAP/cofactor C-like domain-containing protein n=1 Tax=Acer negundo TaxID=4023 RepID=A0AAD5IL39_ACENE|nr:hypothetical protein LWI28_002211 [Acer negundo]